MAAKELRPGVYWVGAVDGERRSFDGLFTIPAGTTYNAYLVRGSERTALVDTVDPSFTDVLLANLDQLGVDSIDVIIINHVEQDHSGSLPALLERYPEARAVASELGKELILDLLDVPEKRIDSIADGGTLALGDRTLRAISFPWVHWPETMLTYLEEDGVLFSCDLFGCHLALSDVFGADDVRVPAEVKRYFACIMMPYRRVIESNLSRVTELSLELIAPSHGPLISDTAAVVESYRSWVADPPQNLVVIPYISMHGSTWLMVQRLSDALTTRGVGVQLVHLGDPDKGALAMALVDAATVVLAAPTVLGGAHPKAADAAFHLNMLRPKTQNVSLIGSYGWSTLIRDQLIEMMPDLDVEFIDPVIVRGRARNEQLELLERLADRIARKHEPLGAPPVSTPDPGQDKGAAAAAPAEPLTGDRAQRYRCTKCGWIYDPMHGDPKRGIPPGMAFADIGAGGWYCPFCGAGKSRFRPR